MDELYMDNLELGWGGFPSVKTNQIKKKKNFLVQWKSPLLKRFKLSHYDLKSMSNNLHQMP